MCCAVALTVYMASQTLVLNYSRKLRDIEPLWFASIANNILWWTFVKACTRTIYAALGEASFIDMDILMST